MDALIAAEEAARVLIIGGRQMVLATMRAEFVEELADLLEEEDGTWSSRPRNSSNNLVDDTSSDHSETVKVPKKIYSQDLLRDTQYDLPPQTVDDIDVCFSQMGNEEKYFIGILAIHVFISTKKRAPELLGAILESLDLPDNVMTGLVQFCNDAEEQELTFEQISTAAKMLRPEARLGTIVAIAASGLKDGTYDARLRWGLKRLAQILKVPWERVAAAEMILASTLVDKAMNNPDEQHATTGKGSSYRWLKVGAGVTVGAGVLLVTGGLAAPFVAAAATTLASTTAGIAAAAGLTAVSTAIGATAASLGTVMTIPVITALFGAAGAGLTGLKVYKRTAGVDSFICKSIRDISVPAYLFFDPCNTLASERGIGPSVPLSARQITCRNILEKQNTGRQIAIAIENFNSKSGPIGELQLVATHLDHGEWMYTPPRIIKPGTAGICCCQTTRFGMRVSGCVVYRTQDGGDEFCFSFECPMVGSFRHRVLHGSRGSFADISGSAQRTLSQSLEWSEFYINRTKVTLSASGREEATFTIDPRQLSQQQVTFLPDQLSCQVEQFDSTMTSYRSRCIISIHNKASSSLRFVKLHTSYGMPSQKHSIPNIIECGFTGIIGFHNKWLRPTGVSGVVVYSFEERRGSDEGGSETFYLCISYSYSLSGVIKLYSEILSEKDNKDMFTEQFLSQLTSNATTKGLSTSSMRHTSEGELEEVDGWKIDGHHGSYCFTGLAAQREPRPGLHVVIGISGMTVHDDPRVECKDLQEVLWKPILDPDSATLAELTPGADPHLVTWEAKLQASFGEFMTEPTDYGTMMRSAANRGATEALKNPVVAGATGLAGATYFAAATMWASLAWPYYAIQAADLIDSTYGILVKKAREAGELLAQMLLSKAQGSRPVTLIGVSLGANVIFHALVALSRAANDNGYGIVESAILIGATVPCDSSRWKECRQVVAGRLVNVYSGHDWFLAFLHRGCTVSLLSVAGLTKVHHQGIENVNVNHLVKVSADYIRKLPEVLQCVGTWPTAQTYCKSNAVPGKIRPLVEADEELDIVAESSLSGNTLAICFRNKSMQTIEFVSSSFDGGGWEVTPTDEPIFPGYAEICMASCRSQITSAVFGICHYTSEEYEIYVVFKAPTYGDVLVAADILPKGSDVPGLEEFGNSKKMGVAAGKSYCDGTMLRFERLGNKLVLTVRQKDGDEPTTEQITSPISSRAVGAGVVVPVAQTNSTLTALLTNKSTLIPYGNSRQVGIAVRNKTPFEMVYCWSYMKSGTWTATPTPSVKPQQAGMCLCSSSIAKSIKGVLCYAVEDKVALLFAFSLPMVGSPSVYAKHVPVSEAGDIAANDALDNLKVGGTKYSWQQDSDLILKLSWKCPPGEDVKLFFTVHKCTHLSRRPSLAMGSDRNPSPPLR
eukprot:TRINITY_DN7748_c1_g1_i1.p1 TRINITY_DN7748_c1_g1~~TRINITY_DN7748_c1_g1_i1.p1  ORF type:complete len:1400 (+),score=296.63 TRINITY_DN7748_c1_g1_i1:91-4290(+)